MNKLTVVFVLVFILSGFEGCKKESLTTAKSKKLYSTRGTSPGIYDADGRFVILRGANYNVLGDYWQANPAIPTTKQYQAEDLKVMASLGFNCVRLLFSWSLLEPEKGVYDQVYIQRIKTVIEEADKNNMYVLLDMHQDAWGKYIATPSDSTCASPNKGWDGAPQWATITDGESTCTVNGMRENAPAVYHAWQNFWDNTNGIQDNCIKAWQQVVQATCTYQNVLGYDLLNEPSLGYTGTLATEITKLSNYYGRLVIAIRATEITPENQHIIFIENPVTYKGNGILGLPDQNFSTDNNIVAAPHHYFESIGNLPVTIEAGYNTLQSAAALYNAALFVGEWGYFGDPATDVAKVKRFAAVEDAAFGSSTWWQWAQAPGDPHGISYDGTSYGNTSMHLVELDQSGNLTGNKNELYLKVLSRPHPTAICGKPSNLTCNPDNGAMHLEVTTTTSGTTELWAPAHLGTPLISGTNIETDKILPVQGGYKITVKVKGNYVIDMTF